MKPELKDETKERKEKGKEVNVMAVPEERLYRGVIQEWAAKYDNIIGADTACKLADALSLEFKRATKAQRKAAEEYVDALKAFRATLITETTDHVSQNMEHALGDLRQHFLTVLGVLQSALAAQKVSTDTIANIAKMVVGASAIQEWAAKYDQQIGASAVCKLADNLSTELKEATPAQREAVERYVDALKAFRATLIAGTANRVSEDTKALHQDFSAAIDKLELVPAAKELGAKLITIAKMVTSASVAQQAQQSVSPHGSGKAGMNTGKRRYR